MSTNLAALISSAGILWIAVQLTFGIVSTDKYVMISGNFKDSTNIMVALDGCHKHHEQSGVVYYCEAK